MAILQSSLVEPLLSRQQAAVIRNIACAAQLNEALQVLSKIGPCVDLTSGLVPKAVATQRSQLEEYLKAEITRALMQIKIPASSTGSSKAVTREPTKPQVTVTTP